MMREIHREYARSFREGDWLVRLQHLYLLMVPVLIVGLSIYLSVRW
ncbi:MAG: hypothetical protein ACOY93_17015 [Bacillota bacterium]